MKRFAILSAGLLLAGCQWGGRPESSDMPAASAEQQALHAHLQRLEAKISSIEKGRGTGAFRNGPTLHIDPGGAESPLERLRRLDRELLEARSLVVARDATITTLRQETQSSRARGDDLEARNDELGGIRDQLVTAQQVLTERQDQIEALRAQLATSELGRLKAERDFFTVAASLLKLTPVQISELTELQEDVRKTVREVQRLEALREAPR